MVLGNSLQNSARASGSSSPEMFNVPGLRVACIELVLMGRYMGAFFLENRNVNTERKPKSRF